MDGQEKDPKSRKIVWEKVSTLWRSIFVLTCVGVGVKVTNSLINRTT